LSLTLPGTAHYWGMQGRLGNAEGFIPQRSEIFRDLSWMPLTLGHLPCARPEPRGHPEPKGKQVSIVAVIPAHNEAEHIVATIRCLQQQTLPLSRIIVTADNCTDNTAELARQAGAEVFLTVGNKAKKAGALNQVFNWLLPQLTDDALILQMDGDTLAPPNLAEVLRAPFLRNPLVGSTTSSCHGTRRRGLLPALQEIEFGGTLRRNIRRRGIPNCLPGPGTMFSVKALRDVANARESQLPGNPGEYLIPNTLTEDFEVTLALSVLGYEMRVPRDALIYTDLMTTTHDLYRQRLRWQRGGIEALAIYGVRKGTRRFWWDQVIVYLSSLLMPVVIAIWLLAYLFVGLSLAHWPWWLGLVGLTGCLRVLEIKHLNSWKLAGLTILVVPMYLYGIWQQGIYWMAVWHALRRTTARWS
jgi:poly-beta-1,6-N-acetyl-D-glucosamine synthase